jgi:hypothetical protein
MEAGRRSYRLVDESPADVIDAALRAFEPQVLTYDAAQIRLDRNSLPTICPRCVSMWRR